MSRANRVHTKGVYEEDKSKTPATLIHFYSHPFLLLKRELFSFPLTQLHFQIKTNIVPLVFTHVLKNAPECLLLKYY